MKGEETIIEYGFLNMDRGQFTRTELNLIREVGQGALIRAIPSFKHHQVLIAAGQRYFDESDAKKVCADLLRKCNKVGEGEQ